MSSLFCLFVCLKEYSSHTQSFLMWSGCCFVVVVVFFKQNEKNPAKTPKLCFNACFPPFILLQEIRQQSSEFPCKVAKSPENKNRNRYRDVSPCKFVFACLSVLDRRV